MLGRQLGNIFDKLRGKGVLTEKDVTEALREIRIALLEADVALCVVKDFIAAIKEKAVGEAVLKSITPGQMVIKIVNDQLVETLSHEEKEINLKASPPVIILMVGLQGSGKTTMSGKLAYLLKKQHKKVLMASLDIYRPAAQKQLELIGEQIQTATLEIIQNQLPLAITQRALEKAKKEGYDVLILDTAGRLHIDEVLMEELSLIQRTSKPNEILFVADALSGQDALHSAKAFHEKLGITGLCLSRIDGDSRGGVALSIRSVTGQPIKLLGTGEKPEQVEFFDPKRISNRILDMGDIVGMVESASESLAQEDHMAELKKLQKGVFTLNDLEKKIKNIDKLGGVGGFLNLLPGMRKLKDQIGDQIEKTSFKKQLAIISSMTKAEKKNPDLLNASRKRRVATGSGTSVQEINRLLKQFQQMQKAMKQLGKLKGLSQLFSQK